MGSIKIVPISALTNFVSRSWDALLVLHRETAAVNLASVGAAKQLGSCPSFLQGRCCLCLFGNVELSEWHEYITHLDQFPDGFVSFKTTLKTPGAVCRKQDGHSIRAVSITLQVFEASEIICAIHFLDRGPCEGTPHTVTRSGARMGFSPQFNETIGLYSPPQLQTRSGSDCNHFRDFGASNVLVADVHMECQLANLAVGTEKVPSPALGVPPHFPDCSADHDDLRHVDGSLSDT